MVLVRPKSLKEMVVDELRQRIVDGRVALGEALSENALADDLGISKTPVREALMQLRTEGLVDVQPQRGSFVFSLAPDQVVAISELRAVLEVAAVELALERNRKRLLTGMAKGLADMEDAFTRGDIVGYRTLDAAYHQLMVSLSGNDYLVSAYSLISLRIQALRARLSRDQVLNARSLTEHRTMLKLAREGRTEELQRLLRSHSRNTQADYLALPETIAAQ